MKTHFKKCSNHYQKHQSLSLFTTYIQISNKEILRITRKGFNQQRIHSWRSKKRTVNSQQEMNWQQTKEQDKWGKLQSYLKNKETNESESNTESRICCPTNREMKVKYDFYAFCAIFPRKTLTNNNMGVITIIFSVYEGFPIPTLRYGRACTFRQHCSTLFFVFWT